MTLIGARSGSVASVRGRPPFPSPAPSSWATKSRSARTRAARSASSGDLVGPDLRVPLTGTIADVSTAAGLEAGAPTIYSDHADLADDAPPTIDAAAADELAEWFARGEAGMRAFAPDEQPVLWPEHFDLGIAVDEVNYGISPGDGGHPAPYANVGPWTQREGPFWNAAFGSLCPAAELPDTEAVAAYFGAGPGRRSNRHPTVTRRQGH